MSLPQYDYVIIGAGPAGMAAAVEARQNGLNVLVLDEQPAVGGQIYRNIEDLEEQRPDEFQKLGADYQEAFELAKRFRASGAKYRPGRSIWQIDPDLTLYHIGQDGGPSETCHAKRILIATGAMERPMPFPGWTLPGVLACTAADVLYKSSGLLPRGEIVLLGSGPLLLLIACRLLDAGVKIAAYLDTNPHLAPFQALPYLPKALRGHEYLRKGIAMLWQMFTSRAKVHLGVTGLEAEGEGHLQKVRFQQGTAPRKELPADLLLLHHGVVPNVQITRQLGCEHAWYEKQRYWEPVLDQWGNTSIENVAVAGDSGRVCGSANSVLTGRLAALETARALGKIDLAQQTALAAPLLKKQDQELAIRPFLDTLFPPRHPWLVPKNEETLVCRCEEVRVREIRDAVRLGALSPDRVKPMVRCGMGPCQARMCGLTVSEIIADERQVSPADVGYFRVRSPIKPVTLGQLTGVE